MTQFKFSEDPGVAHYDWRLAAVTTVAQPLIRPGMPTIQAGTPLVAICPIEYDARINLVYNMPSVCALLLDYSQRMWTESQDILRVFDSDDGGGRRKPTDDGALMPILERRMAAVVFAYTALEAFANEVIEGAYTQQGYIYKIPAKEAGYGLDEIERHTSLEEKLCSILPEIANVKTPKGSIHWQRFGHLRRIRHFIIHPKLPDKIQVSPRAKVLWKLLVDATFRNFAEDAREFMLYYAANGTHPARWLHKWPF